MNKMTVEDLHDLHKAGELSGKMFPPEQLSNEVYHAGPGISHSGLKTIGTKSPQHYAYERDIQRRAATAAMKVGTSLHMMLLETDRFDALYVPKPEGMSFAKKEGKQWRDEQLDAGKEIISFDDYEHIHGMAQAIEYHRVAGPLFNLPRTCEQSIFWTDKKTGVLCRCRPDIVATGEDDKPVIIDLKKTQDCSVAALSKTIYNFSYHTQAPFYSIGYKEHFGVLPAFLFVFVEEKPPHGVRVVALTDGQLDPHNPYEGWAYSLGEITIRHRLDIYAQCLESDWWPGFQTKSVDEIDLPRWAYQREL